MTVPRTAVFALLSVGVSVVVSYLAAETWVGSRGGFGRGDLRALWLWNVPFGVGLSVVAAICAGLVLKRGVLAAPMLAMAFGALYGFAFTVVCRLLLGPWFGAWSFPVLYCWVGGGAFGLGASSALVRVLHFTSEKK